MKNLFIAKPQRTRRIIHIFFFALSAVRYFSQQSLMSLRDTQRHMKSKGGDQTDSVSKTESVFEASLPTITF